MAFWDPSSVSSDLNKVLMASAVLSRASMLVPPSTVPTSMSFVAAHPPAFKATHPPAFKTSHQTAESPREENGLPISRISQNCMNRKGQVDAVQRQNQDEHNTAHVNNFSTSKDVCLDTRGAPADTDMRQPIFADASSQPVPATEVSANQNSCGSNVTTSVAAPAAVGVSNMDIAPSKSSGVNADKSMKFSPGSHENDSVPQEVQQSENVSRPEGVKPTALWKPVKVNSTSELSKETRLIIDRKDYWHKFIVLGGSIYDKNQILKTVLYSVYSTEFIPVLYQVEGPHATFLARDCHSAILKLFRYKFKLNLDGSNTPDEMVCVNLEVILCFALINELDMPVHDYIAWCIKKRYDITTRTLDLSNFANDPDLADTFYCPLWIAKVFNYVLQHIRTLGSQISCLLMSKNELSVIKFPHIGDYVDCKMVDLSENKFHSLRSVTALRPLQLKEVILDKNPLCAQYTNKEDYIRDVKHCLPTVRKLDGVVLNDDNMPGWHRNFVISTESTDFVDQFLERYFTIFDSENRRYLLGIYHEEGCFSMSANYLGGQSTSSTARLTRYTLESRNLFKISDYSKSFKLISHGPEDIVAALCRLPRTEHDPTTFTVDLLRYTAEHIVLTVSGVFREPSMMKQSLVRYFNRTFVLLQVGDLQYQICNEILFISNATTEQAKNSFKCLKTSPSLLWIAVTKVEHLTNADRRKMIKCMADLTEMSPRWAKKCLEESKWKFREALQVFTELLKMDKIPAEAFVKA